MENFGRWYKRGKIRLDQLLHVEMLLEKVINMDLYFKEMKKLNLNLLKQIQFHSQKTIDMDAVKFGEQTIIAENQNCDH